MMCGIFLTLCRDNKTIGVDEKLHHALSRRGPDVKGEINLEFNGWHVNLIGHVLWTQGLIPVKQPLIDSNGNILLWNGDVFKEKFVTDEECDSAEVLRQLSVDENNVLFYFTQLVGPFAFIYWDNKTKSLWFGRDCIGRHSLLWQISSDFILLSSCGNKDAKKLLEVPATGLFKLNLEKTPENLELNFYPWKHCLSELEIDVDIPVTICESISHVVIGNGDKGTEWLENEPTCRDLQLYRTLFNHSENPCGIFKMCLENSEICDRVCSFIEVLSKSVRIRVLKQPGVCRNCLNNKNCPHVKTAVLFSGGLDSTVVALLASKFIPVSEAIDLYNVAFQNQSMNVMNFDVPDRKTGELSLQELKRLCPDRKWNFIKIDITHEELVKWRRERVTHLIHPLNTVLDDSLGCALWFAARGQGTLNDGELYNSSARIVLLGMGVDEMLGGYMRHRTQWRREKSWKSLARSLANDLAIIGQRNLGRDNRVVADHGCQPRLPFLDEGVVAFLQSLPPWKRCYLSEEMPIGVGDKLLLRLVAWKLGLCSVAGYPKRAMQFGSRIANRKEKGNNVSHRL